MDNVIIQPSHRVPRASRFDMKLIVQRIFEAQGERLDANETALHARSLTQVMARPFFVKYPEIKWRTFFTPNTEINTGAKAHSYMLYDQIGQADFIDDMGDEVPNADVVGTETIAKIYSIGDSFSYSLQDMRAAQFAGIQLDSMKGVIARQMIERKLDSLAAVGDARYNMTGLANDANIIAVTKGSQASGTTWATATPSEILADVNSLYTAVVSGSNGAHTPNSLLLGATGFGRLSTTRLDTFNMVTILRYLQNSLPWLKRIDFWQPLSTAGASSKERILLGEFSDQNCQPVVPQDYEQLPPQLVNFRTKIFSHVRWGGNNPRFPKAFAYMDGTEP